MMRRTGSDWQSLPLNLRVQHLPPEAWEGEAISGSVEYPKEAAKRLHPWLWVLDVGEHKVIFCDGPNIFPTLYFHFTPREANRLRWALMFRRDKIAGIVILTTLLVSGVCNILQVIWRHR